MGLEVGTFVNDLVTSNPVGVSDPRAQGDDHLRLIKNVLKNTFPNAVGALKFSSTDAGAGVGPRHTLYRDSPSPATDDELGAHAYTGEDSAGNEHTYAETRARIKNPTNGAEDGDFRIMLSENGVLTETFRVDKTGIFFHNVLVREFVPGTRMIFQQTSAPTGWTKDVTHNDKALRLVNGTVSTGGSVAFTTAFANQSVGATAITAANMPSHTHSVSITSSTVSADHSHAFSVNSGFVSADHNHNYGRSATTVSVAGPHSGAPNVTVWLAQTSDFLTGGINTNHFHGVSGGTGGISANHTHGVSGTSGAAGSGTTHTHSLNIAVQYVDFIIASKD